MNQSLLRLPAVTQRTALPKASIYLLMKRGEFPRPVKLRQGGRAVAWREQDIVEWIESRCTAEAG